MDMVVVGVVVPEVDVDLLADLTGSHDDGSLLPIDKGDDGSGYSSRSPTGRDKYGPPVRTEYRLIVDNLQSLQLAGPKGLHAPGRLR